MKIEIINTITVKELISRYLDLNEEGVYAFGEKLEVRPPYQREFVYDEGQQTAVIDSIIHNYPIGIMYWCKKPDGNYECLDGQQRIISICEFAKDKTIIDIDGSACKYGGLMKNHSSYIDTFHNYKLMVAVCEGTTDEKLKWFERINISGEPLTPQEMKNAIYAGPWTTAAKKYFSKDKCIAYHKTFKRYGDIFQKKLRMVRQEWLEQIILWKCEYDGMDMSDKDTAISTYMVQHQFNNNADDLISYFENMLEWIKRNFKYKSLMAEVDWGKLYNKYTDVDLKSVDTDELINNLIANAKNDGITKPKGIYEYVFDGDVKHLSDRTFSMDIKKTKWDEQNHKCAICQEDYPLEDLAGDHIVPWSKGGKTVLNNCQMLCPICNGKKSNKRIKQAKEVADKLRLIIQN